MEESQADAIVEQLRIIATALTNLVVEVAQLTMTVERIADRD